MSGTLQPLTIALRLLVGIRFQVLFHSPSGGSFHLSLAVLVHYRSPKVFSLGEWTPQLRTGLACPVLLRYSIRVRLLSCTGLSPSAVGHSRTVPLNAGFLTRCLAALEPYNPPGMFQGFGLFRVRSPLLAEYFLLLGVLRCFSSPGALAPHYGFMRRVSRVRREGLPHSEIVGLSPADGSPTLIAAYHVLLRPLAPRHPPYALCSLFSGFDSLEVLAQSMLHQHGSSFTLSYSSLFGC